MLSKNQRIEVCIERMTLQGDGVAHHEGMAVFVPGVCPGDRVLAHVIKAKPNCAFAKAVEVLAPAPQRVASACAVFPACGGCAFRCLRYETELATKAHEVQEILRRVGGILLPHEPILPAPAPNRYRNKVMLPFCVQGGAVCLGFFARHSHRVVCAADCQLHPLAFTRIAQTVCAWANAAACSVYDERTGQGLLRHLYLRQAQGGHQILVCLVVNGSAVPAPEALVASLRQAAPCTVGVLLNHNALPTNVVLGKTFVPLWGQTHVTEPLCGCEFRVSPSAFFQVNTAQAERLYALARDYAALRGHEFVVDLYCGVGSVGLSMAGHAGRLLGVEIVPQAVADAQHNAQTNGVANAEFLCADAGQAASHLRAQGCRPDVVLLDPPRKGCDETTLVAVAQMQPQRVVYISCDPATLARDLKRFATLGYPTTRVRPVDMFPRTAHCEVVAQLVRA